MLQKCYKEGLSLRCSEILNGPASGERGGLAYVERSTEAANIQEGFPLFLRKVLTMQVAKLASMMLVGMLLLSWASAAQAQCVCEAPVVVAPTPAPTVSYLPVAAGPVVSVAPAPVVVYRPVVAAPVVAPLVSPVVVYRPVVPVIAPAPTVVYRPVGPAEVLAPAPMVVGPPAVIRTKVYYPGEPIRNLLKAITP